MMTIDFETLQQDSKQNKKEAKFAPKADGSAVTRHQQTIFDTISSSPMVDLDKVYTIQAALREGRYTINTENIATKMVQLEASIRKRV
jgi:flagellar biosynthesis anti-sigma factor FlgM